jgi:chromosome partitioning protein
VALVDADQQASASAWLAQTGEAGLSCHVLPLETTGNARRWLGQVRDLAEENDYVLIDLPADVGPATQAAVAGADLVVVPITPSPLDFHAAAQLIKLLRGARKARSNGHPACLLVGSKVDRRTAVGRGIEIALKEFKEPVGPSICQRAAFVSAAVRGGWVGAYAVESPARDEIFALARRVKRAAR